MTKLPDNVYWPLCARCGRQHATKDCPDFDPIKEPNPERTVQPKPLQGWQCPGCGSCYAPFISKCTICGPKTTTTSQIGSDI